MDSSVGGWRSLSHSAFSCRFFCSCGFIDHGLGTEPVTSSTRKAKHSGTSARHGAAHLPQHRRQAMDFLLPAAWHECGTVCAKLNRPLAFLPLRREGPLASLETCPVQAVSALRHGRPDRGKPSVQGNFYDTQPLHPVLASRAHIRPYVRTLQKCLDYKKGCSGWVQYKTPWKL